MLPGEADQHHEVIGGARTYAVDVSNGRRFATYVQGFLAHTGRCSITACPRRANGFPGLAGAIWVTGTSAAYRKQLREYMPPPTLLLTEGNQGLRHTALWGLSNPLPYDWSLRANRRIAKWLGGKLADAEPEWLIPLTEKTGVYRTDLIYTAREVVGRLPDPSNRKWRPRD